MKSLVTDELWAAIEPLLPAELGSRGARAAALAGGGQPVPQGRGVPWYCDCGF